MTQRRTVISITVDTPTTTTNQATTNSIETAAALGGNITIPEGTEWFYVPPLIIKPDTTIVVTNGGTATLTPSQKTAEPLDDPGSNAIEAFGDNISLTGIISNCVGLAGHAFRLGGQNGKLTDCRATGFSLKGFGLVNQGPTGPAGIKWTRCHAESGSGVDTKAIVGFQCDTGGQQTKDVELLDCTVGALINGLGPGIALKLATADIAVINNLGFDQDTQRIVLAEGLQVVKILGLDYSRGLMDWLQISPDLTQLQRNQNVRALVIRGVVPKP